MEPFLFISSRIICTVFFSHLFQLNMFTFSTHTIILGHHKTGTKISQPISKLFQKSNVPVHNLLCELCTGLSFISNVLTIAFLMRLKIIYIYLLNEWELIFKKSDICRNNDFLTSQFQNITTKSQNFIICYSILLLNKHVL